MVSLKIETSKMLQHFSPSVLMVTYDSLAHFSLLHHHFKWALVIWWQLSFRIIFMQKDTFNIERRRARKHGKVKQKTKQKKKTIKNSHHFQSS